jgi:hypothetical protein
MPLVRTEMIAPTRHYDYFPALSPDEAAEMIANAIAKRRKKASTALGRLSELTYATTPGIQDAVVNAGYKLFPDTMAARGAAPTEAETRAPEGVEAREDAEPTAERRAFSRLTRGVHW